jgi:hypothetical protein
MSVCVAAISWCVCDLPLKLAWLARGTSPEMSAGNSPFKVLRRHSPGEGAYMPAVLVATQVSPTTIDHPSSARPFWRKVPTAARALYLSRGKPLPELIIQILDMDF